MENEKGASGHSFTFVCHMYIHTNKKRLLPVFYLKISPMLILFQNKEDKDRKETAVKLMGGEENHGIPPLRQQTAGRMPCSPMGILGKYPVKFIRGEKIKHKGKRTL